MVSSSKASLARPIERRAALARIAAALAALGAGPLAAQVGGGVLAPGTGRILIAARSLRDPNFAATVVLLLDYRAEGAMGVIVNRRSPLALASVLPEVAELEGHEGRLYLGGPVARERLTVLIRAAEPPATGAAHIFADVYASGSLATLREVAGAGLPFLAFAGYAGWAPRQLGAEIARGDWIVAPGRAEYLFEADPEGLWEDLLLRNSGRWVRAPGPRLAAADPRHDPGPVP